MANAKISNNSIFIPKNDILEVVGLAGYDNSGNVKISGTQLKNSVLSGAIQTITATSPLERTDGSFTTISIKKASKTQDGYLSSSDFDAFSIADGTVKSVGGTGSVNGITLSGNVTDTGDLTLGGTLSIQSADIISFLGYTPYNDTNPDNFTDNAGTVTQVTTTAPLSGSVTSTGSLSITKANANTDGYLTKGDWTTFNNKSTFDGDYNSLSNQPSIPTNTNELINGNGFITASTSDVLTNKTGSNLQWTNDAGYITNDGDNTFVTSAALSSGTLTLTRNDSVTIDATGFLQVGATSSDALAGDTTTITTQQATEIADNTAKTGITPAQATEIADNTLKKSMVIGSASDEAMAGDTLIPTNNSELVNGRNFITAGSLPTVNDGKLTISVNGIDTDFTANQSGNSSVSITTGTGENFYVTGASYATGTLTLVRNGSLVDLTATGFLQVGSNSTDALAGNTVTITGAQATAISDNSLKTSFPGFGLTSTKALKGDTTTITSNQAAEISANTLKVGYTDALVDANTAVAANTAKKSNVQSDWSSSTGLSEILNKPTIPGKAPVDSVNTQTGAVVLTTGNITEGSNLYYTEARVSSNASVSANTLKQTFPGFGLTSTTALKGDTVIPPPAPVDSVNGQTGAVTLTTITAAQTNEIAANTLKTSMVLGTASNEALAGDTALLQIGSTSTTALAGDTFIPKIKGYTGSLEFMDCRGECLEMVIDNGLIVEVNRAER